MLFLLLMWLADVIAAYILQSADVIVYVIVIW